MSSFPISANIMARNEIWIIADNDNADKMVKFHQLKNMTTSDLVLAQWYIFTSFDIFTQTATSIGNAYQQLERGLLKTMQERPRPPHSIIFLLGDSFLDDRTLATVPNNLFIVLNQMMKQIRRQVDSYADMLPDKAKPIKEIKMFVTKPLTKPERFFKSRQADLQRLTRARHTYNEKLILALQQNNMNFLNPGIQSTNGRAFQRIKNNKGTDKYMLTPEGLHQYWYALSSSLRKLHRGTIGNKDTYTFQRSTMM